MATTRRVSLFHREIRVSLSSAAVDLLFELASVLSEGDLDGGEYSGSTMMTFDLSRAAERVSDPCDAGAARRLCEEVAADPRVRSRARELAHREAEAIARASLTDVSAEMRVRPSGAHIEIDLDVEASVASGASADAEAARPAEPPVAPESRSRHDSRAL